MSTDTDQHAILRRDPTSGEALVIFPAPPRADGTPWRLGVQTADVTAKTGLYFDDPFRAQAAKRKKPSSIADADDFRWRHFPTLQTAIRIGQYLASYLPDLARVEAIHQIESDSVPDAPEIMPPAFYIVVLVNKLHLKIRAGDLASDLLSTTAYDARHERVTQNPELVFQAAADAIVKEAFERTTNDVLGDVVHTF